MNNVGVAVGAVIIIVIIAFALGYYLKGSTSASTIPTTPITSTVSKSTTTTAITTTSTTPTTTIATTTTIPIMLTTTTFTETGLSSGSRFTVIYDGTMKNVTLSSYNTSVGFVTPTGNYSYTVLNYSNANLNFTYTPSPSSGNLLAGSNKLITFSGGATHSATTNTPSNTTTTTIPTNTTNSNPNCVSPVTLYIGGSNAACYAFSIALTYLSQPNTNDTSSATFKITYHNTDGSTSIVTSQGVIWPKYPITFYKGSYTLSVRVNQTHYEPYGSQEWANITLNYT